MSIRTSKRIALIAIMTFAISMTAFAAEEFRKLTKVESKQVCMINEQYMKKDQIAVDVEGKTYYGCCAMCVERLSKSEKSRYAVDPISGKKVDKAVAVIAADEDANVFYFENEKNLEKYNAKAE